MRLSMSQSAEATRRASLLLDSPGNPMLIADLSVEALFPGEDEEGQLARHELVDVSYILSSRQSNSVLPRNRRGDDALLG